MAPRKNVPQPPSPPQLTPIEMQQGIARLQQRIAELEAFSPAAVQRRYDSSVKVLETAIQGTLAKIFGQNTPDYYRYNGATTLDNGSIFIDYEVPLYEVRENLEEGKKGALALLKQAVRELNEELGYAATAEPLKHEGSSTERELARTVFVVHGHDEGAREGVARFLERIGFEPIILHEQASQGRTVVEKVEAHGGVGFAVVILTPDDVGGASAGAQSPRARQNVVLELGYFIGKLGRSRVCALKKGELELPSDFHGVVYTPFDETGGWRQLLARELAAVGYAIDWNLVMR